MSALGADVPQAAATTIRPAVRTVFIRLTPLGERYLQARREWLYRWKLGAAVTVGVVLLGALLKLVTG